MTSLGCYRCMIGCSPKVLMSDRKFLLDSAEGLL